MRMLAMNSLPHDAERRRQEHERERAGPRSPLANGPSDKEEDLETDEDMETGDDVRELDPVDGFPSPPTRARSRRRFVKPAQTTYALSFSRRHALARRGRTKAQSDDAHDRNECRPALPDVSSLSSVLTEVMSGKTTALNTIVDTTLPQPGVSYVVRTAADGAPYVAASDGSKYFENSTIGQIYLRPAPNQAGAGPPRGRRSDLDFQQSGGWRQPTRRSDFVGNEAANATSPKGVEQAANYDIDAKKGSKTLLGFKGFHIGKKKEKKGSASDLNAVLEQEQEERTQAAGLGPTVAIAHQPIDNDFPMLDPDKVDRSRGDSSWEVPTVKINGRQETEAQEPTTMKLLDSTGMQTAHQANAGLQAGSAAISESSGSNSLSSSSSTSSGTSTTTTSKLPRLQPKKDLPVPPLTFDAYDEDDNPLCRSFQNVRDVDLIRSMSDEFEDDGDHEQAHGEEQEEASAAAADDDFPDVDAPDFAGRVRVSSGATSVAEFVGGFKGQLSRRSGASGLVSRKRAVRHARLTAEEQKAADLARKIRDAHNRIPLEFRDEYMSLAAQNERKKKKKWRALGRHVRFNPEVQCREFEVESEEEDDGYDSPDEIVDAVQLVSKRDVVHAEDVVGDSMDDDANESMPGDPMTFSKPSNDTRLSFSDL
ncbi:hypothetical protein PF005_g19484 [Phytophthora fragariae]|uniref:Uncharacterized protein n=1 Tax=Phytophthora fragariae TaxID=53985 RepID=A0A6A3SM43_9STRA|nr:hypothetical protein PF003_g20238 [Phytophthora fragariae]KAE8929458.1 hypothetical protein PF009_g20424 [Phytophthora fragariae]KAE8991284.1 hypothetical protein PF011_g18004 [Phytophthora fragariae]KAE9089636.1 hypothetical protein PF007_g19530 [Phytophthora fragariae]KAE9089863.1 hypothetical protein PF010_g18820 [Phytophthora fragariae]